MPTKKQIPPGERVPLKLTAAERKLVLEDVTCLDTGWEQIIRDAPSGKPVMMTLDDLDDFGGFIAAEANRSEDSKKQREVLLLIPSLSKTIKNKLAKEKPLSVAEVASMTMAVAEDLPCGGVPLRSTCAYRSLSERPQLA